MRKVLFPACVCLTLSILCANTLMAASKTVTIRSEANIKDVLEISVSKSGQSELNFGGIRSSFSAQEVGPISILINVTSNTGLPYQLTQLLKNGLENTQGNSIAAENLKFTTSSQKSKGTPISTPTSATTGVQTIYVSDDNGTSDTISAEYKLIVPASQAPGDYSTPLTYTVSAI